MSVIDGSAGPGRPRLAGRTGADATAVAVTRPLYPRRAYDSPEKLFQIPISAGTSVEGPRGAHGNGYGVVACRMSVPMPDRCLSPARSAGQPGSAAYEGRRMRVTYRHEAWIPGGARGLAGRGGDDAKGREFLKRFLPAERRIFGYILTLVPDRADADDLLQETSLAMWEQFDPGDPPRDMLAWGCRIAYFQVQHHRRAWRRRMQFSDRLVRRLAESGASNPGRSGSRNGASSWPTAWPSSPRRPRAAGRAAQGRGDDAIDRRAARADGRRGVQGDGEDPTAPGRLHRTPSPGRGMHMSPPSDRFDELDALIDALCEQRIGEAQMARLEELILADPEAEARFIIARNLHADVIWRGASRRRRRAIRRGHPSGRGRPGLGRGRAGPPSPARRSSWWRCC